MDTETVSPNFDDIRPLNNSEVKDAIEKLVANEDFERALRYIKPNLNWDCLPDWGPPCSAEWRVVWLLFFMPSPP